jgi:hypothetical protein
MQLSEAQNLTITTQEHTNFRKLGGKCIESRAQKEQLSKPKLTKPQKKAPAITDTERQRDRDREFYPTPKNRNPQEFSSTQEDLTHMKSRKTKKQQHKEEEEEQERQQRAENRHKTPNRNSSDAAL